MKKDDKVTFVIDPEKTKNDIIYENTVNHLHLTMDEQVKFLRKKVTTLESELKERTNYTLLFIFTFIALIFGIGLICFDLYIPGIILVIATFIFVIIKLLLIFKNKTNELKSDEFDKVEEIIQILNSKLK